MGAVFARLGLACATGNRRRAGGLRILLLFAAFHLLILNQAFSQAPKPLKTIIVDAGHGGKDFGAVGQYENSLRSNEKDVTLAIAMKLVAQLKKDLPDVKTLPTRTTDIYQDPREKARIANELGGQLFICIHADSGPLKQGRRQIGTRMVTRYRVTYKGKGRKKKKISTRYLDLHLSGITFRRIDRQ